MQGSFPDPHSICTCFVLLQYLLLLLRPHSFVWSQDLLQWLLRLNHKKVSLFHVTCVWIIFVFMHDLSSFESISFSFGNTTWLIMPHFAIRASSWRKYYGLWPCGSKFCSEELFGDALLSPNHSWPPRVTIFSCGLQRIWWTWRHWFWSVVLAHGSVRWHCHGPNRWSSSPTSPSSCTWLVREDHSRITSIHPSVYSLLPYIWYSG